MRSWFIYILLLAIPALSWAQPEVSVFSESERMLIGDQISITLKLDVSEGDNVAWPKIPEQFQSALFLSHSGVDTTRGKGMWTLVEKWTLTSFDSGFVVIPPLEFKVNGYAHNSDPLLIQVDMPESEASYQDIIDPVGLPIPAWRIALAILMFLGLLLFIFLFIQNGRKNKPNYANLRDPRPLHVQYAEKLQKLKSSNDMDSDDRLSKGSSHLDLYLREGLGVNTATGDSLVWASKLKQNPNFPGDSEQLKQLISQVNSLRFGGADLHEQDVNNWLNEASHWISSSVQTSTLQEKV